MSGYAGSEFECMSWARLRSSSAHLPSESESFRCNVAGGWRFPPDLFYVSFIKACQFKAFEGWHSLLRMSGAGRRFKLNTIREERAAATVRIREALHAQVINQRRAASLCGNVINESKQLNAAARGVFKQSYYKVHESMAVACWHAQIFL